jgi:hypothetical protein
MNFVCDIKNLPIVAFQGQRRGQQLGAERFDRWVISRELNERILAPSKGLPRFPPIDLGPFNGAAHFVSGECFYGDVVLC